jgi:hypothetical protein
MRYVVIGNKMFVYQMADYDKTTNTACLTLYKNPQDFRAKKIFKNIEVTDWR